MIVRIVKLSFKESEIETFKKIFDNVNELIRDQKGCSKLELYQDKNNPSVFFTYSYWESETDLNNYRESELFIQTWKKTKVLFNAKPEAWSVNKLVIL